MKCRDVILISGSLFSRKLMAPNQCYLPQDFKALYISKYLAIRNMKLNLRDLSKCASLLPHITRSPEKGVPGLQ